MVSKFDFSSLQVTKKVASFFKMKIAIGGAKPQPPISSSLGQRGVKIIDFCNEYNAYCKEHLSDFMGVFSIVAVTVYSDKSFSFIVCAPSVSEMIKMSLGIKSASNEPGKNIIGSISIAEVERIANVKIPDMGGGVSQESAVRSVSGTARAMGIRVVD